MKILIRLPNWLGDVVMATAFIEAAKQLYPDAQFDVIIKKELQGIAELIPGLHKIHAFSKAEYKGAMGAFKFGKQLKPEHYDIFFSLPDSLSSALMGWATSAKKRIGFKKEGRGVLLTRSFVKPKNVHRADEYVSLLEQFTGEKIGNRTVKLQPSTKADGDVKAVVINFNSEASSRRMPLANARLLLQTLYQTFPDIHFALIGSPKEKAFVDEVIGDIRDERIQNYAGRTSLSQLATLLSLAAAVVTTDSGPAHLANALDVPVIALFGAGNEHNTAPYNQEKLTVIRAGQLNCEPCVRNVCKLYGVPKCMELLDTGRIINALSLYLRHA